MPELTGTEGHDRIEGSAAGDQMTGGAGNDVYIVNHIDDVVIETDDVHVEGSVSWWATTAAEPITMVRTAANEFLIRVQIGGAPDGIFAEFALRIVSEGVWGIQALRVGDADGHMPSATLSDSNSVWEYAFQLGRPDPEGEPTEFEFYGGGHGFQESQGFGVSLDGVDFSSLPIGTPVNGLELGIVQDLDILLPSDGATPAGSVLLQHIFTGSGMTIQHAHTYLPGFELSASYSAMMPMTGAFSGGINVMQTGDQTPRDIVYGGTIHQVPGTPSDGYAWGTDHNWLVRMSLPSGGPDVNSDWSNAGASGMWISDLTAGYSKIYLNWIQGRAVPANNSQHAAHYSVALRDIGQAPPYPPLTPRAASQGVDTILSSISLTLPTGVEILVLTGSGNLDGYGNALNNSIIGNAGANRLDGAGGANLLQGGAGDDTYVIRTAADVALEMAGEGTDTVLTYLNAYVLAAAFENLVFVGTGDFIGTGNALDNAISGGTGNDVLRGAAGADVLDGGEGNDQLLGQAGDDELIGGSGDDVLDGGEGVTIMAGGTGNDIYYVWTEADTTTEAADEGMDEVRTGLAQLALAENIEGLTYLGEGAFVGTGNALANTLRGGSGRDQLFGLDGDDTLIGNAGDDILVGGAGLNSLVGGAGADVLDIRGGRGTMQGGSGDDIYLVDSFAVSVIEVAGEGVDEVRTSTASWTLSANVENLTYVGASAFTGLGNALDNVIAGGGAADLLNGGGGSDELYGGGGADLLIGGAGDNLLDGGAGLDVAYYLGVSSGVYVDLINGFGFNGSQGIDTYVSIENVTGSAHSDVLIGSGGTNVLNGGDGNDRLVGNGGADTLLGGAGTDTIGYAADGAGVTVSLTAGMAIDGGGAIDRLASIENVIGSAFADLIIGDGGANRLEGADGDDILSGRGGADGLYGGAGADSADYAGAASAVTANLELGRADNDGDGAWDLLIGIENLTGSAFNDVLTGDAGANILSGGLGADTLAGLAGEDILIGGAGAANVLQGGLGNDRYVVSVAGDTLTEFAGEGIDTVETTLSSFTLGTHLENLTFTGTGAFTGTGNSAANILTGGAGNDVLDGGAGDDVMTGGLGDDTYVVDDFGDVIVELAGGGVDTVRTSLGAYTLGDHLENLTFIGTGAFTGTGNALDNVLTGGAGDDRFMAGAGNDRFVGGAGRDTVDYSGAASGVRAQLNTGVSTNDGDGGTDTFSGIENLTGSAFNDTLTGDAGDNVLIGAAGNDILIGLAGADVLDGGDGFDTADYSASAAGVTISLDAGTAAGGDAEGDTLTGIEALTGSAFNDTLTGDAGDNVLIGAAGNDILTGLAGADVLDGGDGFDTADYSASAAGVTVSLDAGTAAGGDAEGDTLTGIEALTGSAFNDTLTGDAGDNVLIGAAGNDILTGLAGADVLDGGDGFDTADYSASAAGVTVSLDAGTAAGGDAEGDTLTGIEALTGSGFDDTLTGDAGDNVLIGAAGIDALRGEAGSDTADYAGAAAAVIASLELGRADDDGDGASDLLFGIENLTGSAFSDRLTGDAGDNRLEGADGDDVLSGRAGADSLFGGAGADTADYTGAVAAVTASLDLGRAFDDGDGASDLLFGIENLTGSASADRLTGDAGDNRLKGADGDDVLSGRAGADSLFGGAGADTADYTGAAAAVTASLDLGRADDDGDGASDLLFDIENLTGSAFDDLLLGDSNANVLRGGAGADTLNGGAGEVNTLIGGEGNDLYVLQVLDQIIELAGEGVDTVHAALNAYVLGENLENLRFTGSGGFVGRGNGLNNVVTGGSGDDTLSGAGGADVLHGGFGNDTVDYSLAAAGVRAQLNLMISTVDGDGETDTFTSIENLTGSAFNDLLVGDGGANILIGGAGADTLVGLAGNDVLSGGAGGLNTLQGGLGDDWYILDVADSVHEFSGEGLDTVEARINTYVLAANIENLIFSGTGDFRGTGNQLDNIITGGAGADILRGGGGADILRGGAGADTADYTLATSGVTARIDQQRASNDGDGSSDVFVSIEHLIGSNHADTLIGDSAANVISGGLGRDLILGGGGDDILSGGSHESNQLQGGTGNDWYILDATDTCVEFAGEGTDTVEARIGSYTLRANIENLIYTGSTKFVGSGNELNNVITGGAQNDILRGGGGDDVIRGGGGVDELQVRGASAEYTITARGDGWLVVDSVTGRDGSTYVESIEVVRFTTGNTKTTLSYPPQQVQAAAVLSVKDLADDGLQALIHAALSEPEWLPLARSVKDFDFPLILCREDGPKAFVPINALAACDGIGRPTFDDGGPILVNHDPWQG